MMLFWNVRGINGPRKQKKLKNALKKIHVNIVCLLERHVKQSISSSIADFILPGWALLTNYEHASIGRIWILHDTSVRMEIFAKSDQAIHYHTYSVTHKKYFFLSVVYSANTVIGKRMLWNEIKQIKSSIGLTPWLVCSDFNSELHMSEISNFFNGMPCS